MIARGFTLIELLIAMALLAILAGIGGRGLVAVAEGHQRLEAERQRWDGMAAMFARLGDDIGQMTMHPGSDADGKRLAVWRFEPANGLLEFSRSGMAGATRVSWRRNGNQLELAYAGRDWLPVLGAVRHLEWRFLDASGVWNVDWPAIDQAPRAVMIIIELEDGIRLERRFAAP